MKLFRLPNVLMVGLTMVLMRYAIISPILAVYSIQLRLSFTGFMAYVLATMLVTAAGYAINDYYDRNLDQVNRNPDDVVAGKKIPLAGIILTYRILNVVALLLAIYASYEADVIALTVCFIIMIGLLYFYTTTYKRQLLIGNLIVSLATALVPIAVYLYEMPSVIYHYRYYIIAGHIPIHVLLYWILGFSIFAFLSGLAREIIKDMEDFEGDTLAARNTVPIVWGMKTASIIVVSLMSLIIASLVVLYIFVFIQDGHPDFYTCCYFVAFLIVPLLYNVIQVLKAKTVADYKFCGDLLKWIMLLGVLYAPLVWFIIHKTFGL